MKPFVYLLLLASLLGCVEDTITKTPQEIRKVNIPKFDSALAYEFIVKQLSFGTREMNTPGHEACKDWLIEQLQATGFQVIPQTFTAKAYTGLELNGTNIIGQYRPEVAERLLLCAHYDTRHIADKDTSRVDQPIQGADDGASGVAVLLQLAQHIQAIDLPMGVDIIFFDAEDYGDDKGRNDYSWALGSQYWSKNLHEKGYLPKYGILLDMVGSADATFPKEGYSMQSAPKQVNKIWKLAKQMGHGQYFVNRRVGNYTDDHRFIIENTAIPMLDVINIKNDGRFGHYHHTHLDDLDIISKKTLQAVGQVILATIVKESNQEKF